MVNKKSRKLEFVSTLRYGHLLIPIFLHAPFRDVSHTPSLFAASFKGSMKCSCRLSAVKSTGAGWWQKPSTSLDLGTILWSLDALGIAVTGWMGTWEKSRLLEAFRNVFRQGTLTILGHGSGTPYVDLVHP